jgi:hypothetical protein
VTYKHYRGSYGQQIMYTPVIISPLLTLAGVWAVFSRRAARTLLPIVSLITMLDGVVGFYFHVRGIARKPGGWRIPVFNVIMGPPVFAPLLFAISGFLGFIASLLRREDDLEHATLPGIPRPRPAWLGWLPRKLVKEGFVIEQDVREGRFQRALGVATAVSAFFSGVEALYSHYKNNFSYRVQWTPILLAPVLMFAGIGAVWSRTLARTLLPIASALALLNGGIGFLYHMRGLLYLWTASPGWSGRCPGQGLYAARYSRRRGRPRRHSGWFSWRSTALHLSGFLHSRLQGRGEAKYAHQPRTRRNPAWSRDTR